MAIWSHLVQLRGVYNMPINIGTAKSLTSGGEALIEKDLITDDNNCIMTHKNVEERGTDLEVNQSLELETPQADKGFQTVDASWLVNVSSDRRITSITFQAWTATPTVDAVLVIRRAGESFYQRALGVITAGSETTFDLTGADFTPIDLLDATAYTFTIVSETGLQIELAGAFGNLPFYKWEYHELTPKEIGYKDDVFPVVQTSVEGVNFGDAMSLQAGGNCIFQTDHVLDEIGALVVHQFDAERAADRFINVAGFQSDAAVFVIDANTLTNPTFLFSPLSDSRLVDIQLRSAGAQTNVDFVIRDNATSIIIWQSMIASIPASGTFKIDFTDVAESNVPIDIFDVGVYSFEFSSEDGDVLLLGETATDQPWLTASFYTFFDEDIAYLSDLTAIDGTFHVDLNTTVPAADRDGSIFRPFISAAEALAAIGTATVNSQHTLIFASGNYGETFVLPIFTHLVNPSNDAESVRFDQVTYDGVGGRSSITRCRIATIVYDTTAAGGALNGQLTLNNVDSQSNISITGRGAGSDRVIYNGFSLLDGLTPCTNAHLILTNIFPNTISGAMGFVGTSAATNLLNGEACFVEISNCDLSQSTSFSVTGDTAACRLELKNSKIPATLTTGSDIVIARDANTVFTIVPFSGTPTIVNLDIAEQVFLDNTTNGLVAENVQDAINEIVIAQEAAALAGLHNGTIDAAPPQISLKGWDMSVSAYEAVTFDTSTQNAAPLALALKRDGLKMFVLGGDQTIYQYTLSTADDVSTATYDSVSLNVSPGTEDIVDMRLLSEGQKLLLLDDDGDQVIGYTLSTAWDLTTAVQDEVSPDLSSTLTTMRSLWSDQHGTKVWIVSADTVFQFSLTIPFNLATMVYDSVSFSVSGQTTNASSLNFSADVSKMFVTDLTGADIYQYTLSTQLDLSTASYDTVSFDVSTQETAPNGVFFQRTGNIFWVIGSAGGGDIFEYSSNQVQATSFDITPGDLLFIDRSDPLNPTNEIIKYLGESDITCTQLDIQRNVFVYIDVSTNPVTILQELFVPAEKPTEAVYLGNMDAGETTTPFDTLLRANAFPETAFNVTETSSTLHFSRGEFNLSGLTWSPDTVNNDLSLSHAGGEAIRIGVNSLNNHINPDRITTGTDDISTIVMQHIDGSGDTITQAGASVIDPTQWSDGGSLVAVSPVGRFTIQYIYFFYGSNSVRCQFGDALYNTIADAEAAIRKRPIVESPQVKETVLTAAVIVVGSATDLSNVAQAKFIRLV